MRSTFAATAPWTGWTVRAPPWGGLQSQSQPRMEGTTGLGTTDGQSPTGARPDPGPARASKQDRGSAASRLLLPWLCPSPHGQAPLGQRAAGAQRATALASGKACHALPIHSSLILHHGGSAPQPPAPLPGGLSPLPAVGRAGGGGAEPAASLPPQAHPAPLGPAVVCTPRPVSTQHPSRWTAGSPPSPVLPDLPDGEPLGWLVLQHPCVRGGSVRGAAVSVPQPRPPPIPSRPVRAQLQPRHSTETPLDGARAEACATCCRAQGH